MRRVLATLCSLSILLASAFVFVGPASAFSGTVNDSGVNVRSAPSLSAPVVNKLHRGQSVDVVGTASGSSVGGNSTWYRLPSGGWVSSTLVTKGGAASTTSAPAGGRWIDVNLSTLQASAMVGNQAVFSTPIVSGRPGWQTPTGTFSVLWKTPMRDMDSTTIGMPKGTPGYYFQPNVPWIMYFTKFGHAIHGNDWVPASAFGSQNTSHGCVGMPISASKYFYDFASVGTRIVIHF